MTTSTQTLIFDEDKKVELIDTLGQIEALASSVHFKVKDCADNERLDFYIERLFNDLFIKLKSLLDELILAYEKLTET